MTVTVAGGDAAVEAELLAALGTTALPLHRRLWIGARLLAAHQADTPISFDACALEILGRPDAHEQEFAELVRQQPYAIFAMVDERMEPGTAGVIRGIRLRDEAAIGRWFAQILTTRAFGPDLGLVLTYTCLVLLYGFFLALDAADPEGGPPIRDAALMQALGDGTPFAELLAALVTQLPQLARILEEPDTATRLLVHYHHAGRQAAGLRPA